MKRVLVVTDIFASMLLLTGFNLDNAIVPQAEILPGGLLKDGNLSSGKAIFKSLSLFNIDKGR